MRRSYNDKSYLFSVHNMQTANMLRNSTSVATKTLVDSFIVIKRKDKEYCHDRSNRITEYFFITDVNPPPDPDSFKGIILTMSSYRFWLEDGTGEIVLAKRTKKK